MKIPYSTKFIDKEDIESVVNSLKNKFLTQGPTVKKFEKNIAKYVGSKYAVAVSSCTAGLHISLASVGFTSKNILLTSAISFVSSSNVAYYLNGSVKFVDIKPDTICIDPNDLKKKITNQVKVVMPVHMGGAAYNSKEIYKLSKLYKKFVIEDCAHSLGSKYETGEMVGSCKYSDISVFSLHPVKSITTGEGGVITTNNYQIYKKLLRLRSHGINKLDDEFINKDNAYFKNKLNPWYYEMTGLGYHYRLTDIQSSLGISQLKKINKFIKKRREIAKRYDIGFSDVDGIKIIQKSYRSTSSNHLYILRINFKKFRTSKNELMYFLIKNNILTQVHYIPIPLQPFYSKKGFNLKKLPNSSEYYDECLSLPCFYKLSAFQQNKIIKTIKHFLFRKKNNNILLLGSTGLLGRSIIKNLNPNYKLFAYEHKTKIKVKKKIKICNFKLNQKSFNKFLEKNDIKIIINTAGLTSLEKCEKFRKQALDANYQLVNKFSKLINKNRIKLIHISTDQIFDKKNGKILENEKLVSKNFYSKTKILAEKLIIKNYNNFVIIRTNFFGNDLEKKSYSDYIINNLKNKIYTQIWSNIFFSPVNLNVLSEIIFKLIDRDVNGIFNVSSNQKISKFNFALKLAKLKNLNKKYLIPTKFVNKKSIINKPLNMHLDNRKLISLFPRLGIELNLNKQINRLNK